MTFNIGRTLFFFLLIAVSWLVTFLTPTKLSYVPIITSLLIISISSFALSFAEVYPFSLRSTVLVFIYFFFGIIPIISYTNDITYWNAPLFSGYDYIAANIAVLFFLANFFMVEFLFGLIYRSDKNRSDNKYCSTASVRSPKNFPAALLCISIVVFGFKFAFSGYDLLTLFTGGRLGSGLTRENSQIESLIWYWFFTPMLSICLVFYWQIYRKIGFTAILLFALLAIAGSPLAMSRFSTAALYMPIIFLTRIILVSQAYNIFLIFSLTVLFPLLNIVRKPEFLLLNTADLVNYWFSIFYSGDFDAYQSLMLVLKYDLVTYGYQLLGPILFMVPRTFWPEKPIGSGEYMAEIIGLNFSNIAASYLTEGYINFGFAGIGFFGIILGVFVSKLDYVYWNRSAGGEGLLSRTRYLYCVPTIFFMMRGDLLSSWSSLVAIILAVEFVHLMIRSYVKNDKLPFKV